MDVKEIVKKMLAQGMNPTQIKTSLSELGFENADAIVESCLPKKPAAPLPTAPAASAASASAAAASSAASASAASSAVKPAPMRSLLSEETLEEEQQPQEHSLFDSPTPQPKVVQKTQAPAAATASASVVPAQRETPADEEPPQLSITSITDEGEKEVDIRQMLEKEAAVPTTTLTAHEERGIKTKLDDAVALLKALQQLNKDILATNREILLRLKK